MKLKDIPIKELDDFCAEIRGSRDSVCVLEKCPLFIRVREKGIDGICLRNVMKYPDMGDNDGFYDDYKDLEIDNSRISRICGICDSTKPTSLVIAVDFDGILFEEEYPNIGRPITKNIEYIKELQRQGHRIVLNTCRTGKSLKEAVRQCLEQGIVFTAINEQDPMAKILWEGETSSKVFADVYLDDHNVRNIEELKEKIK